MEFAAPIPDLDLHSFVIEWPVPLGALESGPIFDGTDLAPPAGLETAVRDLLRRGGFRPSGRNRPASEYLARAESFPRINVAVDAGNAISKHGGLPISVVDADRLIGAPRVAIAPAGTTYVFNPSGQTFDASGLCCVFDDEGVAATPVKDAQRTKTSASTTRTSCIVWGVASHAAHVARVVAAYRSLIASLGGRVT